MTVATNTYSDSTNITDVDGKSGNFWGSLFGSLPGITDSVFSGIANVNNSKANQMAAQNTGIFWQLQNQLGMTSAAGQSRQPNWLLIIGLIVVVVVLILLLKK